MVWKMPGDSEWAKSQNAHEPTRTYGEEIYRTLLGEINVNRVLEIGAAWGVSTMAILTANPKCHLTSVDPDPTIKAFQEVHINKMQDRWSWVQTKSEEFWKQNEQVFDVIYVDGSHLYKDVKNDLFQAWEKLRPMGLLILDDVTHPNNIKNDPTNGEAEYGVSLAAWELIVAKKAYWITTTDRLLAIRRGYDGKSTGNSN